MVTKSNIKSGHVRNPKAKYYTNKEQTSLKNFIQSIYKKTIIEDFYDKETNYKEIDIYLPDLKIGFEYNGSTWHEEGNPNNKFGKPIGYHEEKRKFFESLGIKIYYIWDYEWFEDYPKRQIISEKIKEKIKNIILKCI